MSFPLYELFNSIEELKDKCPSRKHGRTWKQELNYRSDCVQMMQKCYEALKLHQRTLHRAIVLLQRFFSRCSSTEWTAMKKWAIATACVFLATKIDSAYHRLDSVAHACFRALRALQQREPEPEYYNPDGTPGNPAFVAKLATMVREAELDLIFALNFDFNAEIASSIVVYQLTELRLQDAPHVMRKLAMTFACNSITAPRSVVCLLYGSRELALGCISKACRVHGLSGALQEALGSISGNDYVPKISPERLAVVENALPKITGGAGSAADSAATGGGNGAVDGSSNSRQQQQEQAAAGVAAADGCRTPGTSFRGYEQGAAAGAAEGAGLAGVKQVQCAGGVVSHGSASEAATAGPRMGPSPISPDSETGPPSGAYGAAASSGAQQQQQQCRKRAREEGFSSGLRAASEAAAHKAGGMLAA